MRDNKEGLKKFLNEDGFSVLLRAMQSNVDKLKVKSAFLLGALCSEHPAIRGVCRVKIVVLSFFIYDKNLCGLHCVNPVVIILLSR